MSDRPPLHDYTRSRAVLLGTSDYTHLPRVPAAGHSLTRMTALLTGPLCGWPVDRVTVLRNEPGPGDLPDQLVSLFADVPDVALFYYVGHGQVDDEDQLCLALVGSRTEPHRRATTGLPFVTVRKALARSPAAIKILILDCCFSGLATRRDNALMDMAGGTGAYTMVATSAYTTAWFETDPVVLTPQTYFTKYLADLVEAGMPGQPAVLRLHPLFLQLRENLACDQRPVPLKRSIDTAGDFAFAHNPILPNTELAKVQEAQALGVQELEDSEMLVCLLSYMILALSAKINALQQEHIKLKCSTAAPGALERCEKCLQEADGYLANAEDERRRAAALRKASRELIAQAKERESQLLNQFNGSPVEPPTPVPGADLTRASSEWAPPVSPEELASQRDDVFLAGIGQALAQVRAVRCAAEERIRAARDNPGLRLDDAPSPSRVVPSSSLSVVPSDLGGTTERPDGRPSELDNLSPGRTVSHNHVPARLPWWQNPWKLAATIVTGLVVANALGSKCERCANTRKISCPSCQGTLQVKIPSRCSMCNGHGYGYVSNGYGTSSSVSCHRCGGSGVWGYTMGTCQDCRGGFIRCPGCSTDDTFGPAAVG